MTVVYIDNNKSIFFSNLCIANEDINFFLSISCVFQLGGGHLWWCNLIRKGLDGPAKEFESWIRGSFEKCFFFLIFPRAEKKGIYLILLEEMLQSHFWTKYQIFHNFPKSDIFSRDCRMFIYSIRVILSPYVNKKNS